MEPNNQTSGAELQFELPTKDFTHNTTLASSLPGSSSDCPVLRPADIIPWDTPQDAISAETEQLVDTLKASLVAPIFCFIGGPTNCLSLAVFYRQGLKERTNVCLFTLSLLDLLHLMFVALVYGERFFKFSPDTPSIGPVLQVLLENHLFGMYGASFASGFVSTVVASERCFCIYFPLHSNTVLKAKTMAVFLLVSTLIITFSFYVITEKYKVICVVDAVHSKSFLQLATSTGYYLQNKSIVDVFDSAIYGCLLPALFNTVIVGTAIAMTIKLRKVIAWRQQSSMTIPKKEILLTKLLIVLSAQFAILSMPNIIFRIMCAFMPDLSSIGKYYNTHFLMLSLIEMASFMNASLHFFVYLSVGSRYRNTLMSLFRKGSPKYLRSSEVSET